MVRYFPIGGAEGNWCTLRSRLLLAVYHTKSLELDSIYFVISEDKDYRVAANSKSVSSSPYFPIACIPKGRPFLSLPQGILSAG
jgi:hypothetical protein